MILFIKKNLIIICKQSIMKIHELKKIINSIKNRNTQALCMHCFMSKKV